MQGWILRSSSRGLTKTQSLSTECPSSPCDSPGSRRRPSVPESIMDPRATLVIGCDSLLELDGVPYGKPRTPSARPCDAGNGCAGAAGQLHTGHHVIMQRGAGNHHFAPLWRPHWCTLPRSPITRSRPMSPAWSLCRSQAASPSTVWAGRLFTGIEGDHHNVVGLSLPLLRTMLNELGISWPSLWQV